MHGRFVEDFIASEFIHLYSELSHIIEHSAEMDGGTRRLLQMVIAWNRTPDPLMEVIGSDAFTNVSMNNVDNIID